MIDPYVGEIMWFAGNFVPRYFLPCDGRTLSIVEYQTLYSLIGTRYGGDGVSTFALPDLRDRLAVGPTSDHPGGTATSVGTTIATTDAGLPTPATGSLALQACMCFMGIYPPRR